MTAARLTGPTFFAGVFVLALAVLLAIKNWRVDKRRTATCRECDDTQILKDGITADEFRQYHRNLHAAQRLNAEQRARRQNAGRN